MIAVFENDTYLEVVCRLHPHQSRARGAATQSSGGFGQGSGSDSGQLAAEPVSSPAGDDLVVGIALGTGKAGTKCAQSLYTVGWGSATGSLVQTSSTGALNDSTTWPIKDFRLLSCAANSPTLAGGPSGIGELDQEGPGLAEGNNIELVYRRFDLATNSFGAPVRRFRRDAGLRPAARRLSASRRTRPARSTATWWMSGDSS